MAARGPQVVKATVSKVYFAQAEPKRRALCQLAPKGKLITAPIPDDVVEGDRVWLRRQGLADYQFERQLSVKA